MITYTKHILPNGLTLLVHEDHDTPLATVNLLYCVGARDESPNRTGFAHLFEHLMFGGTPRIPDYDYVVNNLGGESNAFTNNDYTNYYLTVPAESLETALALEADRMQGPDFSQHSLEVQQRVVKEEYNQRYMNQPYGDMWLLLRPLCYQVHPYRWCTIGSDIRHVQEATLDDVKEFFYRFYRPNNAILSVAGPVADAEVLQMVERHFGPIPSSDIPQRNYPQEPTQQTARRQEVQRNVPNDTLYKAYPMPHRLHDDFVVCDLISDILSNGNSSRLYNSLVKQQRLFTEVNAYITGDSEPGLFVVSGKLCEGISIAQAEQALDAELRQMTEMPVPEQELAKVVNKYETTFVYSQYKAADRALSLCYYEWLGRLDWVNDEPQIYRRVATRDVLRVSQQLFRPERSNTLIIHKDES